MIEYLPHLEIALKSIPTLIETAPKEHPVMKLIDVFCPPCHEPIQVVTQDLDSFVDFFDVFHDRQPIET